MKKFYVPSILLAIAIVVFGFLTIKNRTTEEVSIASNKIKVVTSFYPLYFFTKEITGDKADITNITPAGAEPHDYEPTAQDMAEIEGSDILVLNGGHLEAWAENIKSSLTSNNLLIVTTGEGFLNLDPHVWLSPKLAIKMVEKITDALKSADLVNADYYESNSESLKSKLLDLDSEYSTGLNSCANRNIITSHSAFGYLASAYNLKQIPIAGLSPDAEPSPKELLRIAKFAKENAVGYIFFESLISPRLAETIATEIGAKTLVLNPIEGLTEKEMAQGKTYITEMRSNLSNLEIALQCKK